MLTYFSLQGLTFISALFYENKIKYKNTFFYLTFFYLFFFCAFRNNVGGDWKRYLYLFNNNEQKNIFIILYSKEFLYEAISFVTFHLWENIFYYNLFFSLIFFSAILPFLISRKNPAFCLFLLIPLGIFILHLGFIRQSIALSFIFLSIYFFENKQNKLSLIFILISIGFHLSSIIFLPFFVFLFLHININLKKLKIIPVFFILFVISIKLILFFSPSQLSTLESLFGNYKIFSLINSYIIQNESNSIGIIYRIIPTIISSVIFIVMYNKFFNSKSINWLNYFYVFNLVIFSCIFLKFYTLADRLNYFSLPFQIVIFSNSVYYISNLMFKKIYFTLISSLFFIILFTWLIFSQYSIENWQNYRTIF